MPGVTEPIARNPDYRKMTEQVFLAAPFVQSHNSKRSINAQSGRAY